MLALSASNGNLDVPLPENSKHLANLLRILTGNVEVDSMKINFEDSVHLYRLVAKYDFEACTRLWVTSLVAKFATVKPLECFALACIHYPTDKVLARASISHFPLDKLPNLAADAVAVGCRDMLSYRTTYGYKANPAHWKTAYIQQLGLKNYSSFVYAWDCVLDEPFLEVGNKSVDQIRRELADRFIAKLDSK
jgi:hypothetical protein